MKGISVFKGVAKAKPYIYETPSIEIDFGKVEEDQIKIEIKLYEEAFKNTKQQLESIYSKTKEEVGEEEAKVFEAHISMLQDPMLTGSIQKYLQEGYKVEGAVEKARAEVESMFKSIPDPYIQARIADVNDVIKRLIRNNKGIEEVNLSDIKEPVIVVAEDLTPSDTAQMSRNVKGIIIEMGSETSHTAIMAKAMGIPAMVGVRGAMEQLKDIDFLILDTIHNEIIQNPSETTICEYDKMIESIKEEKEKLGFLRNKKPITKDGREIQLLGNIGNDSEVNYLQEYGAEGIGLLRTEFIYMNSDHFPTEEEQFQIYKRIAENGGKEIIIRTLDIGGDKQLSYYKFDKEMNPFIGYRAIRFCLDQIELFKKQLRALLRAAQYGNIKIMYPMISSVEELRKANQILKECKEELEKENKEYKKDVEVGIMIEIPSAAMIADQLIKEADFFSIGTNDLCQYTIAVDRMNPKVAYLYQPLHPGVLRLIDRVVRAAHNAGKKVGMCGEMAGDPENTKILIGLGLDELSMSATSIPNVKNQILHMNYEEAKNKAAKALDCMTTEEVKKIIVEE